MAPAQIEHHEMLARADTMFSGYRRFFRDRLGSNRTDTEQWLQYTQSIATTCAVLGAALCVIGVIWLVVAGVLAVF